MIDKTIYLVDENNRLILKKGLRSVPVAGKFCIDPVNRLNYIVNEDASWRREYGLDKKIGFSGKWSLTQDNDLLLEINKSGRSPQEGTLIIKGDIISAGRDNLVFEVKSRDKSGLLHVQLLKLGGVWRSDTKNGLTFLVQKKPSPDTLSLNGTWRINPSQEIVLEYEKTRLKKKTKTLRLVEFNGFWEINSAKRITYDICSAIGSYFEFKVQLESPNLYPRQGAIKFRLGTGVRRNLRSKENTLSLYGAWKVGKDLGLSFLMDYGKNACRKMEFGANVYLGSRDEVTFSLVNKHNEPLGINVCFSHRLLKTTNSQAYLRLKKLGTVSGIEAGLSLPF